MRGLFTLYFLIILISFSCKPSTEVSAKEKDNPTQFSKKNTIIKGVLINKSLDERYAENNTHPCGKLPCIGTIKVNNISQKGMDYHGQFNSGDTIVAFFKYTLGNSAKYFPKKLPVPNDVPINSVIKCELSVQPNGSLVVEQHEMIDL